MPESFLAEAERERLTRFPAEISPQWDQDRDCLHLQDVDGSQGSFPHLLQGALWKRTVQEKLRCGTGQADPAALSGRRLAMQFRPQRAA